MKRLILDYLRRNAVQLTFYALLISLDGVVNGIFTAGDDSFPRFFSLVQFALFMAATALFSDLQHGIAQTFSILPLTAGQIGRACWLATVGIPVITVGAMLFLGAGMAHLFLPDADFPARDLAMTTLLTLLWIGAAFVVVLRSRSGLHGNWRERLAWSGLVVLCASVWLLPGYGKSSVTIPIACGIGLPLTAAGWLYAGPLVLNCAGVRPAAAHSKNPRGRYHAQAGYGGIPRLISATFLRNFLIGLAIPGALALMDALNGGMKSWHVAGHSIAEMGILFPFFLIFLTFTPVLVELRFLRTLPLSATHLAALTIAILVLPLTALGFAMAGLVGLTSGAPAAIPFLKGFALTLAPASMCVFFVVWKGAGRVGYSLVILTMVVSQVAFDQVESFFREREIPFIVTAAGVGIFVMLAFHFTRRAILESSQTYRVRTGLPGNALWGRLT